MRVVTTGTLVDCCKLKMSRRTYFLNSTQHKGCSFRPLLLVGKVIALRNYQCWEELRLLDSGPQWERFPRNQTHSDPHMGGEILKGLILL